MRTNVVASRDDHVRHCDELLMELARCIVTPEVAKHQTIRLDGSQASSQTHVSRVRPRRRLLLRHPALAHHTRYGRWRTWSRHGVGNDPTLHTTTCFETFPFPWPPGQEPADDPRVEAIAQAARELVQLRDAWLNPPGASDAELKKRTLTNLYNARPTWLDNAHRKLDAAVFAAYGWPLRTASDEEILARLLALNLARAGGK